MMSMAAGLGWKIFPQVRTFLFPETKEVFLYRWCRYPSDTVKCKRGSGSYLRDWHRTGGGSEKEAD